MVSNISTQNITSSTPLPTSVIPARNNLANANCCFERAASRLARRVELLSILGKGAGVVHLDSVSLTRKVDTVTGADPFDLNHFERRCVERCAGKSVGSAEKRTRKKAEHHEGMVARRTGQPKQFLRLINTRFFLARASHKKNVFAVSLPSSALARASRTSLAAQVIEVPIQTQRPNRRSPP